MTGYESKRAMARDKLLDDDDTQVYQQAQPAQEPVAYYHPHKGFYWAKPTHISAPTAVDVPPVPLYVKWRAAQRPWVGLTDEERAEITKLKWWDWEDSFDVEGFIRAIEAALKEKNT